MNFRRSLAALSAAAISVSLLASPGYASSTSEDAESIVINGEEFGANEGLEIIEQSFEVVPGTTTGTNFEDPPTGEIVPMKAWGSSYAYSTEILWTTYRGTANAAANIYNGKRLVRVCFWWTRTGAADSAKTCANAKHLNGQWTPSGDVYGWFKDSLGLDDPKTYFHTSIALVDPNL